MEALTLPEPAKGRPEAVDRGPDRLAWALSPKDAGLQVDVRNFKGWLLERLSVDRRRLDARA